MNNLDETSVGRGNVVAHGGPVVADGAAALELADAAEAAEPAAPPEAAVYIVSAFASVAQ